MGPATDSREPGVDVPNPTEPLLASTRNKGVAVPLWPITNMGTFALTVEVDGSMETKPYGDEVPNPTRGVLAFAEPMAKTAVPVAVKSAIVVEPVMMAPPLTDKRVAGVAVPRPNLSVILFQTKRAAPPKAAPSLNWI